AAGRGTLPRPLLRLPGPGGDDGARTPPPRHSLQWRGDGAACDLEQFRRLVERDDAEALAQAAALYRGPLLDGFSLPACDSFMEWLVLAREQLQQQALAALRLVAERRLADGDCEAAAEAAHRHLALDPWREEPHRQLMRALAAAGDHGGALAVFARCRQTFAEALGLDPDAATVALADQIAQELAARQGGDPAPAALAAPAPAPAADERHNLPAPLDELVGREEELARLDGLLGGAARLVTIVGAGGVGKTRLALAAAWTQRRRFADGACWVALAGVEPGGDPAGSADLLAVLIASEMGCRLAGRRPLAELAGALRERESLLVLDNCEQLPETVGVARALLEAAPRLCVLATSRAPLGMEAEALLRLDGLPVPRAGASDPAAHAGVQLFVRRAAAQAPGWSAGPGELADVARLCRLLDGMPLGIELAAHWAGHYTAAEIAAALEEDASFLAARGRALPERQRSLRAVFAYSWRLLGAEERQALARLAVFRGSFDREAARAVAGVTTHTLAALVDASLVRQVGVGQYSMHELLRQFAADELARLEPDGATADRHAAHYLALLAGQEAPMRGPQPREAATIVEAQGDNIRQAWYHAVARGLWGPLATAAHALALYYRLSGVLARGLQLLDMVADGLRADAAGDPRARRSLAATVEVLRAYLLYRQARFNESIAAATAAADEARGLGDSLLEATAALHDAMAQTSLSFHGVITEALGRRLMVQLERAVACCRAYSAPGPVEQLRALAIEAESLHELSRLLTINGQYQAAFERASEALQVARQAQNRHLEGRLSYGAAEALESIGRFGEARPLREQALALMRRFGSPEHVSVALNNLAGILGYLGDYAGAAAHALAGYELQQELGGNVVLMAHTLSWLRCRRGEFAAALAYADISLAATDDAWSHRSFGLQARGDALEGLGRWEEARAAYDEVLALGRKAGAPQVVIAALAGLARVALAQGDLPAAAADETLSLLADQLPASVYEPLRAYEVCYRVLAARGDERALEVLRTAYRIVVRQAAWIDEPAWRRSFLENIAVNRFFRAEAERLGLESPAAVARP
ncbi:MAG TPA: BTAD domain-containing putative transcriptional regulator, partial [Chloroflexaceae bacterium]|nr:BTAD domain-containing putative transcriptional regulator [Chloroflexaceae bacterium]